MSRGLRLLSQGGRAVWYGPVITGRGRLLRAQTGGRVLVEGRRRDWWVVPGASTPMQYHPTNHGVDHLELYPVCAPNQTPAGTVTPAPPVTVASPYANRASPWEYP